MFHLDHDLPGVFIDSFSVYYPDDPVQQDHFTNFTNQLWSFAEIKEAFSFTTIEDILEEYHVCQVLLIFSSSLRTEVRGDFNIHGTKYF